MSMFRSASIALALVWGALQFSAVAQNEKAIPKELAQYVRDAQKAGLKPSQIRQNAVKAGWPEETVDDALGTSKPAGIPPDIVKMAADKESPSAAPANSVPAKPAGSKAVDPEADTPKPAEAKAAEPKTAEPKAAEQKAAELASAGTPKPVATADPAAVAAPAGIGTKPAAAAGQNDDYLIGEGDVVQIAVYGEPTASVPSATVRPDGKISMPLLKDVTVAGMTPAQVENMVQEQLGKVIREPDVTVIVSQINSKKVFLTGAVKREGPLKYTYRMTILQAISEAGGLTDYAKRKKIYVLHNENGRQYKLAFDYTAVLKGEHMEQNIQLSPGDTIVVP
jgi:polysaccharide export outer membrane protein